MGKALCFAPTDGWHVKNRINYFIVREEDAKIEENPHKIPWKYLLILLVNT